jgi:hypothetical protein
MRASQNITPNKNYGLTPAQRRLSAGANGSVGMRFSGRRAVLPPARRAELIAALIGSLIILGTVAGLMAI